MRTVVIYQEVITHEHVVSMMKAAIRDTQDQPMFVSLSAPFSLKSFRAGLEPLTGSPGSLFFLHLCIGTTGSKLIPNRFQAPTSIRGCRPQQQWLKSWL